MKTEENKKLPLEIRVFYLVSSAFLLCYGAYGLYVGDLFVRAGASRGIRFHGMPAWFMYAAFVFASLAMLSHVARHYDRSADLVRYRRFAKVAEIMAWSSFACAGALLVIVHRTS